MNIDEKRVEGAVDHLKEMSKIRIAEEAIMMQDAQQLLAMEREKAKGHNRRFLGGDFRGDEMGDIHIGDVNQQVPPRSTPSGSSSLTRKAIAAGLLALGGGGVGAGGMALYEYLASQPPPAAESFEDKDTDTQYEMRIIDDR